MEQVVSNVWTPFFAFDANSWFRLSLPKKSFFQYTYLYYVNEYHTVHYLKLNRRLTTYSFFSFHPSYILNNAVYWVDDPEWKDFEYIVHFPPQGFIAMDRFQTWGRFEANIHFL